MKLPNSQHLLDHKKTKGIPKNYLTYISLTTLKPLTLWMTKNLGKQYLK